MPKINQICICIPYFGKWPVYIELFLYTLAKQKKLKVMLFTDLAYSFSLPSNVEIIPFSLEQFNQIASSVLEVEVNITDPYKLCDFKPAYGVIFEKYITPYSYWAFGDLDLIYGDTSEKLPSDLEEYDVITFREEWLSGSLTIMKNSSYINTLFKKSKSYKKCFSSEKHMGFDECWNLYHVLSGQQPDHILRCDKQESFTWVIRHEEKQGRLKVFSKKIIKESVGKEDFVYYGNGVLKQKDGKSFLYYHYITEKKLSSFCFPPWKEVPDEFYINRLGFFKSNQFLGWKKYPISYSRYLKGVYTFILKLLRRIYQKLL